ncbi:MAG: GNAT family N-acetyltransferase [Bacteroidales bacterium]
MLYLRIMEMMHFDHPTYALRPWRTDDAPSLVRHANNRNVSRNLRDAFPYPYTQRDAESWLRMIRDTPDNLILAIVVHGEAAGGIALHGQGDVPVQCEPGVLAFPEHWGGASSVTPWEKCLPWVSRSGRWLRILRPFSSSKTRPPCGCSKRTGFEGRPSTRGW